MQQLHRHFWFISAAVLLCGGVRGSAQPPAVSGGGRSAGSTARFRNVDGQPGNWIDEQGRILDSALQTWLWLMYPNPGVHADVACPPAQVAAARIAMAPTAVQRTAAEARAAIARRTEDLVQEILKPSGQRRETAPIFMQPFLSERALAGLGEIGLVVWTTIRSGDGKLLGPSSMEYAEIKTAVELQLRTAGLAFHMESAMSGTSLEDATFAAGVRHAQPTLIVTVGGLADDGYTAEAELVETVHLDRNAAYTTNARTWTGVGCRHKLGGPKVSYAEAARIAIAEFCNEYLKANPKK